MKRLMIPAVVLTAMFGAAMGNPAFAAEPQHTTTVQGEEKVNQLIVFGNDPCPASTDAQITVCARKDEGERYRIPVPLRDNPNSPRNEAWTEKVKAYETVGAFGTNSCSPAGGTGATGCLSRLIHDAYAARKQSSDVQFGKLIQAEREKRLQSVDADAAAEQARVETLEKEYDAKLAKERAEGEAPAPEPTATPQTGHQ